MTRTRHFLRLILRQIPVLESEIALLPLAPGTFPVKVNIHALLILLRYCLRLGVSLEPRQVLYMESPRLSLQFLCSKILLICSRMEIKDVKQCLDIKLRENSRRTKNWQWCLRVISWRMVWIPGRIVLGLVRVLRLRCT